MAYLGLWYHSFGIWLAIFVDYVQLSSIEAIYRPVSVTAAVSVGVSW